MDVLNLWNDDPEEVLMDLGFGCDELDLSGRIPARFINHQSQARGINLQVFLEAQKNRLDLENPDVSYRFRQLEVLQQVTTAFSSLVGSSSPSYTRAQLLPEVQDRRRRVGMLFKRASKKSLSQINNQKNQDVATTPSSYSPSALSESSQSPLHPGDKKIPSKRSKPELLETGVLSPRVEEQGTCPDLQLQPHVMCQKGQDYPLPVTTLSWRKKRTRQINESFEIEEWSVISLFLQQLTGLQRFLDIIRGGSKTAALTDKLDRRTRPTRS
ncbi:protein ITPRID1 [Echeneis naucrates]|uniref:protein ITPRID1 n=1 Tax=Echeneis naucrates TaxID=173247 RepID=UPI0011139EDA|nr:protein ITPRID1-like [Echeneis naucrates]